jgi:S-formylglutathione hydrolase
MNLRHSALLLAITLGCSGPLFAQSDAHSPHGTVERIKVHDKALEGNLEGDSADRDVSIYLPPSYAAERNRRYPVIYLLHGYTDSDDLWFGSKPHFINVPAVTDKALASGAREMIIVMPNAYTGYAGSMYSSSATTGDWEAFVTRDLVSYIDSHYRTIPEAASRGLAGHSMGGYGTVRIGMKNPDVFSSLYILSPCCMTANTNPRPSPKAEAIHSATDLATADFGTKAQIASAAAWFSQSEKPAAVFRPSLQRRRIAARGGRQVGRQRAARDDRPIHFESTKNARHRHGCGRQGRAHRQHGAHARPDPDFVRHPAFV